LCGLWRKGGAGRGPCCGAVSVDLLTDFRAFACGVQISGPCLADVDWKVNLSLASSSASSLRKPSVQLALYLEESCAARKEVVMELDKAQLDLLIESVSKLRQATDSIPL